MSIDAPPRRETTAVWVPIAVVAAVAALALALTALAGTYGLPRNDDWSYSDLLWRWHATGDLRLGGWESMTLVGQLLLAWPVASLFPRSAAALQVFTSAMGAAGALAAYGAVRRFLSPARALLATGVTLVSPLYAPLAVSFMTDVPAFALQCLCAWMGAVATTASRHRLRWFAAAMAVGLFAVTVREYAVVAPLAVLTVFAARAWGRGDRRAWNASVAAAVIGAVFVIAFVRWRRSWAHSLSLQPSVPSGLGDAAGSFGRSAVFTVVTLTFLTLPVFAFAPLRAIVRRLTSTRFGLVATVAAVVVLCIGAVTTWQWSPPLLGPYLDQRGALGNDILPGERGLVLPDVLLRVLLLVTLVAAVIFVGIVVREAMDTTRRASSWRDRCAEMDARTLAWCIVVFTVGSLTLAGTLDLPVFDRYVLPAVPFAAGLVLTTRPATSSILRRTPRNFVAWTAVAVFVVLGLLFAWDSARFDAVRWQAGTRAVDLGYPSDRVDAGFEWRNVHRTAGTAPMSPSQHGDGMCVRLAAPHADLGPDAVSLFSVEYWHGMAGNERLTAWALPAPGCPPLP